MINKQTIQRLAFDLLNDDQGVCEAGYDSLCKLLESVRDDVILPVTDAADGRYFIKQAAVPSVKEALGIK